MKSCQKCINSSKLVVKCKIVNLKQPKHSKSNFSIGKKLDGTHSVDINFFPVFNKYAITFIVKRFLIVINENKPGAKLMKPLLT